MIIIFFKNKLIFKERNGGLKNANRWLKLKILAEQDGHWIDDYEECRKVTRSKIISAKIQHFDALLQNTEMLIQSGQSRKLYYAVFGRLVKIPHLP